MIETIRSTYVQLFGEEPYIVRSPGRVNLIGEHTDYNDGYVLPAAIDKAIYFAIMPRDDRALHFYAADLKEEYVGNLDELIPSEKGWANYLLGVFRQFEERSVPLRGCNCVFGGDIPIGAGLSSSAAIEAGLAFALREIFQIDIDNFELVKLAQRAENEFVGVQCGIMDQYVNIFGRKNAVLHIDCRTLEHTYHPVPSSVAIVLFDTRVSHSLAASEYNKRRMECAQAVRIIAQRYPEVTHLRDVSPEMLGTCKDDMTSVLYRRAKYVVEENIRVLAACDAFEEGDLRQVGKLMYETHKGLSKEYEVSCAELDELVELVKNNEHVYGARMMGGGFGGCTVNLVDPAFAEEVSAFVRQAFAQKYGYEPFVYRTAISAGTEFVPSGKVIVR